jgi:hypothetical protein
MSQKTEETVGWIWNALIGGLILWTFFGPIDPNANMTRLGAAGLLVVLWFFGGFIIISVFKNVIRGRGGPDWGRADDEDMGDY